MLTMLGFWVFLMYYIWSVRATLFIESTDSMISDKVYPNLHQQCIMSKEERGRSVTPTMPLTQVFKTFREALQVAIVLLMHLLMLQISL